MSGGKWLHRLPPPSSPLVRQYLLAFTTFALSLIGFACALASGLSYNFLYVSYSSESYENINEVEGEVPEEDRWYYDEMAEQGYYTTPSPSPIGIFCNPNDTANNEEDGLAHTLSKAFLSISIAFGIILLLLTIAICTILPISSKIWNAISYLSAITFIVEMPLFLMLDSAHCQEEGASCSLGKGSIPLFVSMAAYLILAFWVQWKDCPDWREEYELWKLRNKQQKPRGGTEECFSEADEERGVHHDNNMAENGELNHHVLLSDDNDHVPPKTSAGKEFTQSNIEKMDLLSHDDLLDPKANDTPLILRIDDDVDENDDVLLSRNRETNRQLISQFLREERHRKEKNNEHHNLHGLLGIVNESKKPMMYVSINEDQQSSSSSSKRKKNTTPITPTRHQSSAGGAAVVTPNVSPITPASSRSGGGTSKSNINNTPEEYYDDGVSKLTSDGVSKFMEENLSKKNNNATARRKPPEMPLKSGGAKRVVTPPTLTRSASFGNTNNNDDVRLAVAKPVRSGYVFPSLQQSRSFPDPSSSYRHQGFSLPDEQSSKSSAGNSHSQRGMVKPPSIFQKRCNVVEPDDDDNGINLRRTKSDTGRANSSDSITSSRIVSPAKKKKDHDPDIVFYQSESSFSTLSLPTDYDNYHSSSDEEYNYKSRQQQQNAGGYNQGNDTQRLLSSTVETSSDADSEELSQVIAGVMKEKANRLSGKITPLNKRRRRKKNNTTSSDNNSTYSSISGGYSSHGSLLDEIIIEEGTEEADYNKFSPATKMKNMRTDDAGVPDIIDASPSRRKWKKKRDKDSIKSNSRGNEGYASLEEGFHNIANDNDEYHSGYEQDDRVTPDNDDQESLSSRASRARRNRILVQHDHTPEDPPDNDDEVVTALQFAPMRRSPEYPEDEPIPIKRIVIDRGMNNRSPPMAKTVDTADYGGGDTYASSSAWEARKVRMARLRMNRAPPCPPAAEVVATSTSGSADTTSADNSRRETEMDIIRASDLEVPCSSDEDSI